MQPHAPSWYAATAHPSPPRPPLDGDAAVDVCVVGAGMTGLSAALHLAQAGLSVRVLEGERVGFGASGRSGGQMLTGFNKGQDFIARLVGRDDARRLWDLCEESMTLTRSLIARHNIACDLTDGAVSVALKARHLRDIEDTRDEWSALGKTGLEVWDKATTQARIASPDYIGALYDPSGAHLHPLNYTLGLAAAAESAGAVIHEDTPVLGWEPGDPARVRTARGTVRARFVLLCGNAYLWRTERRIGKYIMPVGTYIVATEPLGAERAEGLIAGNHAVCDMNFVLNYFRRSSDHRMLFGGRVSYSRIEPASVAETMRRTMVRHLPHLKDVRMDYAWGGYVAITVNRLPQFGRLAPNVLFAHGYSGHGVALTGLAGKLMAEVVAGTAGRFDLFTRIPHLPFPGGTLLRTPLLVLAMAWHRLRDAL